MADYALHTVEQTVPLKTIDFATGTWTYTANSGMPYMAKSAADTTSTITIPIPVPMISGEHGVKIKSIVIPMRIATADLDAVLAGTLYRANTYKAAAAAGTNIDAVTVPLTETGAQVTAAATDRVYTATVTTPDFPATSTITRSAYTFSLSVNAGTTSVVWVYEPIITYETYL